MSPYRCPTCGTPDTSAYMHYWDPLCPDGRDLLPPAATPPPAARPDTLEAIWLPCTISAAILIAGLYIFLR